MPCRGTCERFKVGRPLSGGRYAAGQKRCQTCQIFMNVDADRCPCCNYKFRTKPRNGENKKKFRKMMELKK